MEEAHSKLELLNEKESSLTVSSGENASDVENEEINNIRRTQLKEKANAYKSKISEASSAKLSKRKGELYVMNMTICIICHLN